MSFFAPILPLVSMAPDLPGGSDLLKGGFRPFDTPLPASAAQWDRHKAALRQELWKLLGDLPPLFTPQIETDRREPRDGCRFEHFTFDNGAGDTVYGYVLVPDGLKSPAPAILYNHYHWGKYELGKEELITEAHDELDFATGEVLARAGYLVLGIDAYAFGERRFQGPAGAREQGRQTEESLFKTFLWQGRTLWGMMVRDDLLALNVLASRPDVDPQRIAAVGMSMGATRTWWAAALDDRIKVAVSVACLTCYQNLIDRGAVREHGIYYYVPNMLGRHIDTESVVACIAPRAHLTLTGGRDAGSPADGVRLINKFAEQVYGLYGRAGRFRGVLYPEVEHAYTPEMWRETLAWLHEHL